MQQYIPIVSMNLLPDPERPSCEPAMSTEAAQTFRAEYGIFLDMWLRHVREWACLWDDEARAVEEVNTTPTSGEMEEWLRGMEQRYPTQTQQIISAMLANRAHTHTILLSHRPLL